MIGRGQSEAKPVGVVRDSLEIRLDRRLAKRRPAIPHRPQPGLLTLAQTEVVGEHRSQTGVAPDRSDLDDRDVAGAQRR